MHILCLVLCMQTHCILRVLLADNMLFVRVTAGSTVILEMGSISALAVVPE